MSFTHGLDENDPLGGVAELLAAPDLMVVNLETTIAEPEVGSPLDKTYIFKSPPRSVDLLRAAGVDAVSLANNHTLDYRREGLLRTIQLLDEGGITHVGAGLDADMAYAPRVLDVGDWRVALVGFTHVECGWVADDLTRWPEAAWACPGFEQRTVTAVDQANRRADVVVVLVHWGIERDHCPQPYQRELAADWIEAGADLVIGSHPHVLQSVEQIGGAWVVHSTGNFAFPSARGATAETALFTLTFDGPESRLRAIPMLGPGGRLRPAGPGETARILELLSRISFGVTFDEYGEAIPADPGGDCGPGLGG